MPELTESFIVEISRPGERLDVFLRARYPALSRGAIQRLIAEGHITINGRTVKPTHRPRAGERVMVIWPEPKTAWTEPEAIPLDILYEDDDLLVLNKPAGMVVHPGAGNQAHTLVNALLHHCRGGLSGIGGVARPGLVHRLDKETSGCLVVAKNDPAHLALSAQFKTRATVKIYHAIVGGELSPESGQIQAAIARDPVHRQRMAVTAGAKGREALTSFRVLRRLAAATLLELRPHTGRTHQIRVHLKHLGHPVAGDAVYGAAQSRRLKEATGYAAPRVLLHAHTLEFRHPRTGEPMKFSAPWPDDFAAAVLALSKAC